MFRKNYQFFEKSTNLEKKLEEKANFEKILILKRIVTFEKKIVNFKNLKFVRRNCPVSEKLPIFRKNCQFSVKSHQLVHKILTVTVTFLAWTTTVLSVILYWINCMPPPDKTKF